MGALFLLGGLTNSVGGGMDAVFIERMIQHHDDATAMAELALERSERPGIRELAAGITTGTVDELSRCSEKSCCA